MKNLKFLFCSLLLLAFCFSVSAHSDVKKSTKIELVKQMPDAIIVVSFQKNDFSILKVLSFKDEAPQTPLSKSFIYADVELWNYFYSKSKDYHFYNSEDIFKLKNDSRIVFLKLNQLHNVPAFSTKNYCFRSYRYCRKINPSVQRLC